MNLQTYWWLLIAVLGAALVVLLFVQGGQTFLFSSRLAPHRSAMIGLLGRKWELTFTTLVVFGGAFFASFPLFYSTSFGGAYWLWILILFSFVLQAVSYEFRSKKGNLFGSRTYDAFLLINGSVGCVLLGVAVAMFFFGAEFTVAMGNILTPYDPVISQWSSLHGLEAIADWRNLLLGFAVLFLARSNAAMYFIHNERTSADFMAINRRNVLINGILFLIFFLTFVVVLLVHTGLETTSSGDAVFSIPGSFTPVVAKYFYNFIDMPWVLVLFLAGVLLVLYALVRTPFDLRFNSGIWYSGVGTALVVVALFCVAGLNNTPFYPSQLSPGCSLTINNSSSSLFTLRTMAWVSLIVPVVVAYIAYVWKKMENKES